jgi:hypothetical protein
LEQVHIGEFDLLQCTPPSPRLLELSTIASYGEQVGHIQVIWESISQPDAAFWNPIDHFLLTEKVFLPTGVVSNVISINYPRVNYRDNDVLPDTVYEYSIQVVGINGFIRHPGNYLNIRTPPDGLNSEGVRNVIVSTDWQPNR